MSDIPWMMVSDGTETNSVAKTFSSNIFANTALLVIFIVLSQLATDHSIEPSGCYKTSRMSKFLELAIRTICPNSFKTGSLFL